jgi:metallo-beta-lactamase family protein
MRIDFHGAAHTVTGSQHLITIGGRRVLLDCGLYQGRRADTYQRNLHFPFPIESVEAVILSHAHIDHSGNLPNLVKQGYAGPIYATRATCELAEVMLLDSGHIQEEDAAYVNKRRFRRGEAPIKPLYTQEDASRVRGQLRAVGYDEPFEVLEGVTARLVDAGHILGSAAVVLDFEERGRARRLWFSGDIGRRDLPLIRDPILPERAETMIMECTYGDKPHRDPQEAYEELRAVVKRTVERGGKVIVPAFAVGRTQELVYDLYKLMEAGEIPRIPVYVDSPLAVNVTEVFRRHPDCFDAEAVKLLEEADLFNALGMGLMRYVRSVEESKALNLMKEPMVILSASGMAETGRILHHLRNNIENSRNTVLIVSWQAPETLGRRLAEREQRVKIFGEVFKVRAEVATIGSFSAHAGQNLLVEYALVVRGTVRQVFLVHGEPVPARALMERLREAGLERVFYPGLHTSVEI